MEKSPRATYEDLLQRFQSGQHLLAGRRSIIEELPFSSLDDDFCASYTTPSVAPQERPSFFDLPGELRNKIYARALGGQEIHINVNPMHDEERTAFVMADRLEKAQSALAFHLRKATLAAAGSGFGALCATARMIFAREYENIKLVESGEQKATKKPFTTYSAEHAFCWERFQGRNQDHYREMRLQRHSKLPLNLLATCRKVYEEASFLPFISNTFSFDSVQDFQDFIVLALTKHQASLLTTVHIFDGLKSHNFDFPLWSQLKQETLDLVTDLRELQMTIELDTRVRMTEVEARAKPKQLGLNVKVMFEYKDQAAAEAHTFAARKRWEIEEILGKGGDALDYGWVLSPRMPGE